LGKRALIIYRVDKGVDSNSGVIQKLAGQVEALISLGLEVDYIVHDGLKIFKNQELIAESPELLGRVGVKWKFWNYLDTVLMGQYDLIFIRYTLMIPTQFVFIQLARKLHPSSKIIFDMPTYPYEQEWQGWKGRLGLYWDRKYRSRLSKYVDGVTHSGKEQSIFEIKTIPTGNGIASSLIADQNNSSKDDSRLNLITVGKLQFWHGLDRLIRGLKEYLDVAHGRKIHIHVVGEGPEKSTLEALCSELHLTENITFHGPVVGSQLLSLIDQADIAIGTLGLHRKNVAVDSSLKHRLYCARGIPFVLSSQDVDFEKDLPYVYYADPDESNIEFEVLIKWFDRLDKAITWQKMTSYAESHLSWKVKMKQIVAIVE